MQTETKIEQKTEWLRFETKALYFSLWMCGRLADDLDNAAREMEVVNWDTLIKVQNIGEAAIKLEDSLKQICKQMGISLWNKRSRAAMNEAEERQAENRDGDE